MTSLQILADVQSLLHKIDNSYASQRAAYISELQDKIWDESNAVDEAIQQTVTDVADELNFYESEERDRDEELGYYGDDKLNLLIAKALKSIGDYLAKS